MFKNAMFYRICNPDHAALLGNVFDLEEALSGVPEAFPTGSQWRRLGWSAPVPTCSENLVWSTRGAQLITMAIHERDLKGTTIKEHIAARVKAIEDREQRKIYRKEIAQIRDDVEAMLLPKAFIKHSYINVLITGDLLIIDSGTAKKSEDVLDCMRNALGQLAVRPLSFKVPAQDMLTDAVKGRNNLGNQFAVLSQAKLVNEVKATVSFKDCNLSDEEPQTYLDNGFKAAELALSFFTEGGVEQCRFRVNDQLIFKAIKFNDLAMDNVKADSDGDKAALIDGSLMIFQATMLDLVNVLAVQLGEDRVNAEPDEKYSEDLLLDGSTDFIQANGVATPSNLQRRFKIGYNRAARLIEQLEELGVVTPLDERGERRVVGYTYPESDLTPAQLRGLAEASEVLYEQAERLGLQINVGEPQSNGAFQLDHTKLTTDDDDDDDEWESAAKRQRETETHEPTPDEDDDL